MAKIVYGKRNTATVDSIYDYGSITEKAIWNYANSLGVNIIRVRANKERYETTTGDTFEGYHSGKVSIYNPINSTKIIWRLIKFPSSS